MEDYLPRAMFYLKAPRYVRFLILVFIISLISYGIFLSAPSQFPINDLVVIPEGSSVSTASRILENRKIIRSKALFMLSVKLRGQGTIQSGSYLFDKKENVFKIGKRLATGDYYLNIIKVTFFEGTSVTQMAKTCAELLPGCSEEEFKTLAKDKEGYLFPDTYFFWESATADEVIRTMNNTFNQKIAVIDKEIRLFGKSLEDVIIMASIIEKEGLHFEDKQMISSILWKRIGLDMALQVDATLDYALGKNTYELTTEDLASNNAFNTYKYKGLPPAPITNPGLESIRAAISPQPTKYLFYLTDRVGRFYYAETHDIHVLNKQRYLNRSS